MDGPVTSTVFTPADISAPGLGTFGNITQTDNSHANVSVLIPSADADGSPLTGLVKANLAVAPVPDGIDVFAGLDAAGVRALGHPISEISLTPDQAGTLITFPITFSGTTPLALAVWFQD